MEYRKITSTQDTDHDRHVSDIDRHKGQTSGEHIMATSRTTSATELTYWKNDEGRVTSKLLHVCVFLHFNYLLSWPTRHSVNTVFKHTWSQLRTNGCFSQYRINLLDNSHALLAVLLVKRSPASNWFQGPIHLVWRWNQTFEASLKITVPPPKTKNKNGSHTQQLVAFDDKTNLE